MLVAALTTILAADLALARLKPPWLLGGLLDEPAHLATGVLVLANLPAGGPAWTAGYGVGSVVVDVDHLPLIPVRHRIRRETPRPPAHTLLVPAGLGVAACFAGGRVREGMLGVASGACVHFLRDVATGSGLAPLQPLMGWRAKAPHTAYLATMALLAAKALRFRTAYSRSRPSVAPRHIPGASGRGP